MNGKGDKPRNCFSKQYKTNFEQIDWKKQHENTSGVSQLRSKQQVGDNKKHLGDRHKRQS